MSIYYQDEYVTLYHGDCLKEHREWLDADVLVTDPPYGMSYVSNKSKHKGPSDKINGDDTPELRDASLSAWGNEKPALVFGTWRVPRPENTRHLLV